MPHGTPQHNGVSERHNRTLLDIVQSMMSLIDLPLTFWGYALETTTFTLNRDRLNPLRRHRLIYGLARNLRCRFLKFGVVTLMSKGFSLISLNPNQRSPSSYDIIRKQLGIPSTTDLKARSFTTRKRHIRDFGLNEIFSVILMTLLWFGFELIRLKLFHISIATPNFKKRQLRFLAKP